MPNYPLLSLPNPTRSDPPPPNGGGSRVQTPNRRRQADRLSAKFDHIKAQLQSPTGGLSLRQDPSSIAPERALVFEVIGTQADFLTAASRIEGLEYLAEDDGQFSSDTDFHLLDKNGNPIERKLDGKLYMAMPTLQSLQHLISLWEHWTSGNRMHTGFGAWTGIFSRLKSIRPWGPEDRISEEDKEILRETLQNNPNQTSSLEVELWYRDDPALQQQAFAHLQEKVQTARGTVQHTAIIPEIRYQAALITLPNSEILGFLGTPSRTTLVFLDDIMFIRPQSKIAEHYDATDILGGIPVPTATLSNSPPILALLDGIPVQNHALLAGKLIIDDPEQIETLSPVGTRHHGTKMASLLVYGDLNAPLTIRRRVYVRPILYATSPTEDEKPAANKLFVDVIHTAIKRMKAGDNEGAATAPEVFLVNLSIGDLNKPFCGPISPLARLLDFLANQYNLLFFVSAGNAPHTLNVPGFSNWTEFETGVALEKAKGVLLGLNNDKSARTILSPAESLNGLTVGAWHKDSQQPPHPRVNAADPFVGIDAPNITSRIGLGYLKSIKPDILVRGGREEVTFQNSGAGLSIRHLPSGIFHGLKVAAVGARPGVSNDTQLECSTSAATAMASHTAHALFDTLINAQEGFSLNGVPNDFYAVIMKTLMVHRASWRETGAMLDTVLPPIEGSKHKERRDNISRLLGLGFVDEAEVLDGQKNRAILVGYGQIVAEEGLTYNIPMPVCLNGLTVPRKLVITAAWLSPLNPRNQFYRMAKIDARVVTDGGPVAALGVSRSGIRQADDKTVDRGTVFHEQYSGENAVAVLENSQLAFQIFCREKAGTLENPVKYAVAVTIESSADIPIYTQVRDKLAARVRV